MRGMALNFNYGKMARFRVLKIKKIILVFVDFRHERAYILNRGPKTTMCSNRLETLAFDRKGQKP